MANEKTFHCSVVTPERAVLEADARMVVFPAHDGERGIMPATRRCSRASESAPCG